MTLDPIITLPLAFDARSGGLTDAKGYHCDSLTQALHYYELNICPCGHAESIGNDIIEMLLALDADVEPSQYVQQNEPHEGQEASTESKYQQLLLSIMSNIGLVKHEGSMFFMGAYLSEHGKAWVESIKAVQAAEEAHFFG